jgi:hypothetical protein
MGVSGLKSHSAVRKQSGIEAAAPVATGVLKYGVSECLEGRAWCICTTWVDAGFGESRLA